MTKSKECPQCRKVVMEVKKNPTLNNLIEKYIEAHPESKKSKEEITESEKNNKISSDVLRVTEETKSTTRGRKKAARSKRRDDSFDSSGSASDSGTPQRVVNTQRCEACKKNIGTHGSETCMFCTYIQHTTCRTRGRRILAISSHNIQGIPVDSFSGNKEEQKIVSTYIVTKSVKMVELYEKLTNDMETNKWPIKDSNFDNKIL